MSRGRRRPAPRFSLFAKHEPVLDLLLLLLLLLRVLLLIVRDRRAPDSRARSVSRFSFLVSRFSFLVSRFSFLAPQLATRGRTSKKPLWRVTSDRRDAGPTWRLGRLARRRRAPRRRDSHTDAASVRALPTLPHFKTCERESFATFFSGLPERVSRARALSLSLSLF